MVRSGFGLRSPTLGHGPCLYAIGRALLVVANPTNIRNILFDEARGIS
jgi:hypothetical protein